MQSQSKPILHLGISYCVEVSFDYGASGNESVGAVCGANNISIEFSDETWPAFRAQKNEPIEIAMKYHELH